jgi:hypothetical protein
VSACPHKLLCRGNFFAHFGLTPLSHQTRIAPIIGHAHRDRRHSYFLPQQNRLRKRWGCSGASSTLPAK